MLTARDTPADRIAGLDAGADDYLVKPFDFGELLARLRALQRRSSVTQAPRLVIGELELDPAAREARIRGQRPSLTATELGILEILMRRYPGVADRLFDRTARLGRRGRRVRLEYHRCPPGPAAIQAGRRWRAIETVRAVGYRIIAA